MCVLCVSMLGLGLSLYAGIILRIIGYKFGKNNAGIIGCLQAL